VREYRLCENAPARIEIEYKYNESRDAVEPISREILEREDVRAPVLYCECGEEFMEWEPAMNRLRQVRK
jgi:hypothetical protein